MSKKALIAMSGGVDSSVAAFLMKEQGCEKGTHPYRIIKRGKPIIIKRCVWGCLCRSVLVRLCYICVTNCRISTC